MVTFSARYSVVRSLYLGTYLHEERSDHRFLLRAGDLFRPGDALFRSLAINQLGLPTRPLTSKAPRCRLDLTRCSSLAVVAHNLGSSALSSSGGTIAAFVWVGACCLSDHMSHPKLLFSKVSVCLCLFPHDRYYLRVFKLVRLTTRTRILQFDFHNRHSALLDGTDPVSVSFRPVSLATKVWPEVVHGLPSKVTPWD